MKILALDTAEKSCSIAIVEDQVPMCEEFYLSRQTHSRTLMDMVVHMVEKRAGLTIHDMDGFVVACGPGSFTGLRIGISVVKGLAYAISKPSAGISSLDGIGCQFSYASVPVCVMMDAKRGEVYSAVYNFVNGRLIQKSKEFVISPEQAVDIATKTLSSSYAEQAVGIVPDSFSSAIPGTEDLPTLQAKYIDAPKCVLFAGSGAVAYRHMIQDIMGDAALFVPLFQNFVSASALAYVLFEDTSLLSMSPDAVTPVYLRKSDAEINYQHQRQCFC
ncbi:MAG: tRNA (adenosine(37)-N6)-threonylcarbamoyltransferase complex dimerization subunit type 1 TsaB [Desulfamplus sp.]|nr:tRNA (adenosine(37)-N6)-threonylcarbamoyltransferase complex dimerization subunit type 1 TsaB [Desulfamplus sp.]